MRLEMGTGGTPTSYSLFLEANEVNHPGEFLSFQHLHLDDAVGILMQCPHFISQSPFLQLSLGKRRGDFIELSRDLVLFPATVVEFGYL